MADQTNKSQQQQCRRVGLVYDERMCKHSAPEPPHYENPESIRAIWNKLVSAGIPQRCEVFKAKEVEDKYIEAVHSKIHTRRIKTISSISSKEMAILRKRMASTYDSIYFNEASSESAYLAAGSVLGVAEKVAKGELNSAFAIVRPPGHHAEKDEAMGFCLYNNVAIATQFLLDQKELGIIKILIVDWDVHHGNGEGPGLGYNINDPWENGNFGDVGYVECGDADYVAAWDHILIPVAKAFKPDIILISAGFDAAIGDPLGGCRITPNGYGILLKKLMEFSKDKPITESTDDYPFESTWRVIKAVREELSTYWPILADKLPEKLTSRVAPLVQTHNSESNDEYHDGSNTLPEDLQEDVTIPFSTLKLTEDTCA
nr:hypothetical protein [Tanacetum cinerariifolium]